MVEKIDFDFGAQNYSLVIVNTGKGHADLGADYSSVPQEMRKVAAYFGKEACADITEEDVIRRWPMSAPMPEPLRHEGASLL